jgi:small subunit ribosomal protein S20
LRRRSRNRHIKVGVGTLIKRFRSAVGAEDAGTAAESFAAAERAIRKAATKGVIPKKRADRHISRLAKSLNGLTSS